MKTKNSVILISVICTISLFLLSFYISSYLQCSEGLQWDLSCSFPERTDSFIEFVKQKATAAFEMTLQRHGINSEQLTVQDGLRWNKEFFMAESIADDGNRYFLMAVFAHNVPVDKIDVQIFKIVSDKCTTGHILNRQGCPPEYTQELKNPISSSEVDNLSEQSGTNSGISMDRTVYPDPQFCADEYDKMYLKAAAIPCGCCNPPPGEPVCEPVPIEDHIRDMITEEFNPCMSTIDRWAHLSEYTGSVWFAFGTNYVKLKMEKTNHEENIPISITFSGYSQCLDDFYLIVKEHEGDRKVVFKEKYDQVCDDSKPNNEFKTYREISLEGVGKPIVLSKGQYLIELYTDTPQMHAGNYVDKVYFSSHHQ